LKNRQKKQEKQINDICDYRKLTESDFVFLFLLQHFKTNVIKNPPRNFTLFVFGCFLVDIG